MISSRLLGLKNARRAAMVMCAVSGSVPSDSAGMKLSSRCAKGSAFFGSGFSSSWRASRKE